MLLAISFVISIASTYVASFLIRKLIKQSGFDISVVILISIFATPVVAAVWWASDACISETLRTIPLGQDATVEILGTGCDAIAHSYDFSVVVARGRWGRRTTVFSYTPAHDRDPPPGVDLADGPRIVISAVATGSIGVQLPNWNGIPVEYRIGPAAARSGD